MKVLEIYPKDIHIVFEIALSDLQLLHKALGMITVSFDSKKEDEAKAANYLTKTFFPVIDEIMRKKGNES